MTAFRLAAAALLLLATSAHAEAARCQACASEAGRPAVLHDATDARSDAEQAGRGRDRSRHDRHRPASRGCAESRRVLHQERAGRDVRGDDVSSRRAAGNCSGRRSADEGSVEGRCRTAPAGSACFAPSGMPRRTRVARCRRSWAAGIPTAAARSSSSASPISPDSTASTTCSAASARAFSSRRRSPRSRRTRKGGRKSASRFDR